MKIRQRRAVLIATILITVSLAVWLILQGMAANVSFYRTPSQLVGVQSADSRLRVGGLVATGSVQRDGVQLRFAITDTANSINVTYGGLVPDLFREGQGVVVEGKLQNGVLVADKVLARHDENYMPPEVARALQAQGKLPAPLPDSPAADYQAP